MPDATKDFLGSGWKFPPRLDAQGRIELAHQEQDVEEAVRLILLTRKGERPMRPQFGSDLFQLQFAPNNASTAGLASRFCEEALRRWEPRIDTLDVQTEIDPRYPERLLISIRYRIKATNDERNLVFPFYTIPGED